MEVYTIPNKDSLKARYSALGKKLKRIQEDSENETREKLAKGLEDLSTGTPLPEDLANYLLGLKQKERLPSSILPSSLFKRPIFFGREDFFNRLASELVGFGLAYQRVYLQPIRLSKLAELFHKHRPWWQCDIKDIETAVNILLNNSIIQKTDTEFLFEPLTISKEVQEFLNLINDGISEFGEISISLINQLVPWDKKKIEQMINLLSSNKICFLDEKEKNLYFPELKRS